MEIKIFNFADETTASNFPFYIQYTKARHRAFIERLGWPMPAINGHEFDQYDLPFATYIFAIGNDQLLGGCRLIPCSNQFQIGAHNISYMLLDAQRGKLDGIPKSVADHPLPETADHWELSRLTTNGGAHSGTKLVAAAASFIRQQGGAACIFLGTPAFIRFGNRAGLQTETIGPIITQDSGRPFQALRTNLG